MTQWLVHVSFISVTEMLVTQSLWLVQYVSFTSLTGELISIICSGLNMTSPAFVICQNYAFIFDEKFLKV